MVTKYPVELSVTLRPVGQPWVRIGYDNHTQVTQLKHTTTFDWQFDAKDQVCVSVQHFDKSDMDPTTAVEIVDVSFFGIQDPKFAWAGVYRPVYPVTWYNQQTVKPRSELPGQTYLGWNGCYSLTFDVPVFTWMHKVLNLGWIYS